MFESEHVFCVVVCGVVCVRCCVGIVVCVRAYGCIEGGVTVSRVLCFHTYFIPHECSQNKQK